MDCPYVYLPTTLESVSLACVAGKTKFVIPDDCDFGDEVLNNLHSRFTCTQADVVQEKTAGSDSYWLPSDCSIIM